MNQHLSPKRSPSCKTKKTAPSSSLLPAPSFSSTPAHAEVLAHWSFDELVADGHAFADANGTLRAIVSDTSAATLDHSKDVPFGAAVALGPGGTGLNIPALPGIYEHSFSVAAWVKLASATGTHYLLADWDKPPAFFVGFNGGKITASLRSTKLSSKGSPLEFFPGKNLNAPISPNVWHHVAWVWNRTSPKAGTMTIYLDGAKVAEASTSSKAPPLTMVNNNRAAIGYKADSKSAFHGSVDELWVFNDPLTPDQVSNLMKSNNINSSEMLANVANPVNTAAAAPATPSPTTPTTPATPTATATPSTPTPAAPTTPPTANSPTAAATTPPPADNGPITFTTGNNPPPANTPTTPSHRPHHSHHTRRPHHTHRRHQHPNHPRRSHNSRIHKIRHPHPPPPNFSVKNANTPNTPSPTPDTPPALAVTPPPHYTPARVAGILASGFTSLFLSAFLLWANNERGKLRSSRR